MPDKMQRICFLGKGGIGKSVITANISEALVQKGYRVLQIGNDISLSSTLLLRGQTDITPVLEEFREKYVIQIEDYIVKSESGVYCLELGSIEPGSGCMARGISIADEMLESQGVLEKLKIDYVLYDITGETPCTGYILPIRDGMMQQCIVVTDGSFAALSTANSMITGILRSRHDRYIPIQLLVNFADRYQTRPLLKDYGEKVNIHIAAYLDYYKQLEYGSLDGKTVLAAYPQSEAAQQFAAIAEQVVQMQQESKPMPFERKELLLWSKQWKKKELDQKNGVIGVEDSQNI